MKAMKVLTHTDTHTHTHTHTQNQNHVLCSFAYTVVCIDDTCSKPIDVVRRKNAAYEFIKAMLKEYEYCKEVMKKTL